MTDGIIYDCPNTSCKEPLLTGRCKQKCWDIYNGDIGYAYWERCAKHGDRIWVECSNCGFRTESYNAVILDSRAATFSDVKYKFCPMCGKEMRIHK